MFKSCVDLLIEFLFVFRVLMKENIIKFNNFFEEIVK